MKQKKFTFIILALLVALLLPVAALAATSLKISGKSASLALQSFDSSGCIYTDVSVYPSEKVSKDGGKPSQEPAVFVGIFQYDYCRGEFLIDGRDLFPLGPSDFTLDSQLQSAQLNTTIQLFNNATFSTITLDIDLTWTGVGETSSGKFKSTTTSPGCKLTIKSSGTIRGAEISGSVSDGTTNLISGLEPYYIELASVKESTKILDCNG